MLKRSPCVRVCARYQRVCESRLRVLDAAHRLLPRNARHTFVVLTRARASLRRYVFSLLLCYIRRESTMRGAPVRQGHAYPSA